MRKKWSKSVTGGGAAQAGPPVVGAPGGLPAGALGGPPSRYALRWTAFACFGERRLGALRVHPYKYDANYPPQERSRICERRVRRCSRSEEHTSELQSRLHLVCRLLLEKKKRNI